jgi:hypothetical protein
LDKAKLVRFVVADVIIDIGENADNDDDISSLDDISLVA